MVGGQPYPWPPLLTTIPTLSFVTAPPVTWGGRWLLHVCISQNHKHFLLFPIGTSRKCVVSSGRRKFWFSDPIADSMRKKTCMHRGNFWGQSDFLSNILNRISSLFCLVQDALPTVGLGLTDLPLGTSQVHLNWRKLCRKDATLEYCIYTHTIPMLLPLILWGCNSWKWPQQV